MPCLQAFQLFPSTLQMPKIHFKMPKTVFWALSKFPYTCTVYRTSINYYNCNLPKTSPKMPKIPALLPKAEFLALPVYPYKCPVYRLSRYSYKCNLPKIHSRMPKTYFKMPKIHFKMPKTFFLLPKIHSEMPKTSHLLPNLKFLAFHLSLTNALFIGFPAILQM